MIASLVFLAALSSAASVESPALRAALPVFSAVSQWKGAPSWTLALESLAKVKSPGLQPLAEALASAGPILQDIGKLSGPQREEFLARLEAARSAAGPIAARKALESLKALDLGRDVADDRHELKKRADELEEAKQDLDGSVSIYGDIKGLRDARRSVAEEASALRGRLVTLPLREQAKKLGLSLDDPAAPAPQDKASLQVFLEERHKELIASRPDMFLRKMKKAADSDFAFFRGFPDIFYLSVRSRPEAADLLKSPKLFLAGDLHAENIELSDDAKGRKIPQVNDFDDAGPAPVAADLARMLTGVGLIGGADAAELYQEALEAYKISLKGSFHDWATGTTSEKAVENAKSEDRDWPNKGGKPLKDKGLAAKLLKLAGLDPAKWTVLDRMGAGLSSIGVLRYLFVSDQHKHAVEFKQLRASAMEFLTGHPLGGTDRDRLAKAYKDLRQIPVEAKTLERDGADWMLRRREGTQWSLNLDHPKSAARVIGGLVAQLHLAAGGTPAELEAAARQTSLKLALSSLQYIARMCALLVELLGDGTWARLAP